MVLIRELNIYIKSENVKFDFMIKTRGGAANICNGYKSVALVTENSEQQFNVKSHFVIFGPVVGEGQLYYDTASQALICIFL